MTWVVKLLLRSPLLIAAIGITGIGGAFQYGFQISVLNAPSTFVQELMHQTYAKRYRLPMKHWQFTLVWSFYVAIFAIGGLLGSLCAGRLANTYGRKKCLLLNNLVAISAALLTLFSKSIISFEMIMAGRFLYGINAGIGMLIHIMYLVECAPKRLRSMIGGTVSALVGFGEFTAQILSLREFLGTESLWPWLMSFGGFAGLLQLLTLPLLPESPRYLLLTKNDRQACENAMTHLWGKNHGYSSEIEDMLAESASLKGVHIRGIKELLTEPSVRWQLLTVIITSCTYQLCGINAVGFYAFDLLKKAGISTSQLPYAVLGTGMCEVLGGSSTGLVIENAGKKTLLSIGYFGMTVSMALLTVTLYLQELVPWMCYCSMGLIFIFLFLFTFGAGATSSSLPGDLFDQSFKGAAYTVSGTLMWLTLFLVGLLFPLMMEYMGSFCFLIFLTLCFGTGLFVWFHVPETKNRTVLEIAAEFERMHSKTKPTSETKTIWTIEISTATNQANQMFSADMNTMRSSLDYEWKYHTTNHSDLVAGRDPACDLKLKHLTFTKAL